MSVSEVFLLGCTLTLVHLLPTLVVAWPMAFMALASSDCNEMIIINVHRSQQDS